MTWEEDSRVSAINALVYYWDPVTWPFPPVPLFPLALGEGFEQTDRGDSDLSGVEGSYVWPQSVKLRDE